VDLEELDLDDLAEEGWPDWFAEASAAERAPLEARFDAWLDEDLDDEGVEQLYRTATAQGRAYIYWACEDEEVLEALGVVIIEGDCPGSSYLGAELRIPIATANQVGAGLGGALHRLGQRRAKLTPHPPACYGSGPPHGLGRFIRLAAPASPAPPLKRAYRCNCNPLI
jgi:hypothetical protein